MRNYFLIVTAVFCLSTAPALQAAPSPKPAPAKTNPTTEAKLDRILTTQQEILKKLEELKEEVEVVKIRSTR